MLVLNRRKNETIAIGDDIEVTVVGVEGGRIKLGVIAPREMRIRRKELPPEPVRQDLKVFPGKPSFTQGAD